MSQTYLAIFVMIAGALLPKIGVVIANDALTNFFSVAAVIIGGIWGLIRRYKAGGVTAGGFRK